MIDTHMHITMEKFDNDREKIVKEFDEVGVECAVEVGYDLKSSKRVASFAQEHEKVYAAVGIHPHDSESVMESNENWIETISELLKMPKIVALGEIGLDYYRDLSPRDVQKEIFRKQLKLAEKMKMPIIFHVRDAYADVKEMVKNYNVKGVIHSFNGNEEDAKDFVKIGFYIGVGGIATYKRNGKLREIISHLPIERIVTETDCPYLSPQAVRGKRNEPKNVRFVLEMLAELFGKSFQEMEKRTAENARRLFEKCV